MRPFVLVEQGFKSIKKGTLKGSETIIGNIFATIGCFLLALGLGYASWLAGASIVENFKGSPPIITLVVLIWGAPHSVLFVALTWKSFQFTLLKLAEKPRRWIL